MSEEITKREELPKGELASRQQLPEWMTPHGMESFTTIDTSTEEGFRRAMSAALGADKQLSDSVNMKIAVKWWIMKPYEKIDEHTGETISLVHITIGASDGTTYACSSMGVRKSLIMLSSRFGFKEWKPALICEVRSIKAKMGSMFALNFVGLESVVDKKIK